jgi:gamma-glutamyl hydrolase
MPLQSTAQFALFLLSFSLVYASNDLELDLTLRPTIGILSIPSTLSSNSFMHASYVYWLQQGGARVVPIPFDTPPSEMQHILTSINGVLFTGGALDLEFNSTFVKSAQRILQHVVHAQDYFPMWVTCMGFQMLTGLVVGDLGNRVIVPGYDAYELAIPLEFTDIARESKLFKGASEEIFANLASRNITANVHHFSIQPELYRDNPNLREMFDVLSYNHDRKGRKFVSSIEGKNLPIFGVQWHPEKPQYEWDEFSDPEESIPHDPVAYPAMQYFSNFFVSQARKNSRRFNSSSEESKYLIYNFAPREFEDTFSYVFPFRTDSESL